MTVRARRSSISPVGALSPTGRKRERVEGERDDGEDALTAGPSSSSPSQRDASLVSGQYTHIHGVWYDLSSFASFHPGGPTALGLAAGRDATALFESHHTLTRAKALRVLSSLPRASPRLAAALYAHFPSVGKEAAAFDFSAAAGAATDAFEADVKGILQRYLKGEAARRGCSLVAAAKAPLERWLHIIVLTLAFVFLGAVPLVAGHGWALLTAPILAWVLSVNFWHDASHFAMSPNWRINEALLYVFPVFTR